MEWVCGVGVRQGLSGASVPRSRHAGRDRAGRTRVILKNIENIKSMSLLEIR